MGTIEPSEDRGPSATCEGGEGRVGGGILPVRCYPNIRGGGGNCGHDRTTQGSGVPSTRGEEGVRGGTWRPAGSRWYCSSMLM